MNCCLSAELATLKALTLHAADPDYKDTMSKTIPVQVQNHTFHIVCIHCKIGTTIRFFQRRSTNHSVFHTNTVQMKVFVSSHNSCVHDD